MVRTWTSTPSWMVPRWQCRMCRKEEEADSLEAKEEEGNGDTSSVGRTVARPRGEARVVGSRGGTVSTAGTRGEEAQGQVAVVLREVGEEARVEKVARVARAAR